MNLAPFNLRPFFNDMTDAVISIRSNGTCLFWNKAAEDLFGWNFEEVDGIFLPDIIIPTEDRAQHIEVVTQIITEAKATSGAARAQTKTGKLFQVSFSVIPMQLESEQIFCVFFRESSSQETHFIQAIIQSIPGIFYFFDHSGKMLRWNNNFEKVTGYSGAEISKMHPLEFFDQTEHPYIQSRIEKTFIEGVADAEAPIMSKTGARPVYFFTGIRTEYNGIPCLVGMGLDITRLKEQEKALLKTQEEIRSLAIHLEAEREKERQKIARDIHEDLSQELASLKLLLGMTVDRTKETHTKETIQLATQQLTNSIQKLRVISKELHQTILDDLGITESVQSVLVDFGKKSGLDVRFECNLKKNHITPQIDTTILKILDDALSNVQEHANASIVTVALFTENSDLILKIRDNGRGFDQSKAKKKTSLGLVNIKEKTLAVQGQLDITTGEATGTELLIRIPLPRTSLLQKA